MKELFAKILATARNVPPSDRAFAYISELYHEEGSNTTLMIRVMATLLDRLHDSQLTADELAWLDNMPDYGEKSE